MSQISSYLTILAVNAKHTCWENAKCQSLNKYLLNMCQGRRELLAGGRKGRGEAVAQGIGEMELFQGTGPQYFNVGSFYFP